MDKRISKNQNPSDSFATSSTQLSPNIIALVRHLARISAEYDYSLFLRSVENRYTQGEKEAPSP